jgi:quercetin dioxygenase-like cupin family protein
MDFPSRIRALPSEQHDFLHYHLKADGCDVFFSEVKKGTDIAPHTHDVPVINFVIAGAVGVSLGGAKEAIYRKGDCIEIPAGMTHTLRALEESRLIELWFRD